MLTETKDWKSFGILKMVGKLWVNIVSVESWKWGIKTASESLKLFQISKLF